MSINGRLYCWPLTENRPEYLRAPGRSPGSRRWKIARQDSIHLELPASPSDRQSSLVAKYRTACNHSQMGQLGKIVDQAFRHSISQVLRIR